MKLVLKTDLGKLYQGDGIEILKSLEKRSVDLLFTDPPYGLNYNDQNDLAHRRENAFGGKIENKHINAIQSDGEEEANELFQAMLREAKRVLKKGACCCCCCGGGGAKPLFARWMLWMDEIIGFNHAVVWDKPGLGMGIHWRRSYEFLLIAQNGSPCHRWNGGRTTSNVWRIPKIIPSKDQHPTEKPFELFAKAIQLFSNPGDLIVDPFAGSGILGVVCERLNRRWICVELDENHAKSAKARISAEAMQVKMKF